VNDPIGHDPSGSPVYLREIWPNNTEIHDLIAEVVGPESFRERYGNVFDGNETWNAIPTKGEALYAWDEASTYIQEPPFFLDMTPEVTPIQPIVGARCLLRLGDSVTTDHISPAGSIAANSAAGEFLMANGVELRDFNSYGSRRGNDRVMTRGTFANIRVRNRLAPGTEGGYTTHLTSGEVVSVYEASQRYKREGTPLVVLAGHDYGMGSSRDWAAKGTLTLGVKAVIAKSFERIHRSNLVFMGLLPLVFKEGEDADSLGLTGHEHFDIALGDDVKPRQTIRVTARRDDGSALEFEALARIDSGVEVDYYRNGGILQTVLRNMLA
jgi:aconitate hydratase